MLRRLLNRIHKWTAPPSAPRIPGLSIEQQTEIEHMEKIRAIITDCSYKMGKIYMGPHAQYDDHFSAIFATLMQAVEKIQSLPTKGEKTNGNANYTA